LVPRIKPLWNTPEKEVGMWAILNGIEIHLDECPYSNLSLRAKIKEFLNKTESKHPGTKENVLESFKEILDVENIRTVLNECERCGEPTSAKICKACEIKDIVNENKK
ncbi:MAG: TIGR00269 family protein, partial [Methanobrevibacter sp.]|nr:TIGR00269 family protein [Methanobrevibacter sp.]